eukprot:CAMPEP_0178573094 /NCGR_PEP_ID=MMETSP0697-20121206/18587_1 /TAXON_ID=265572 /ORGANISM="Extubocellulus spinifer, Strain CCMP396" /LENGTH=49 /DNA_ID= /DNA_START= /DNA_END= /DNA_ORIENTATION=
MIMVVHKFAALDDIVFLRLEGMNRPEILNQNIVDDAKRLVTIGFFLDMV